MKMNREAREELYDPPRINKILSNLFLGMQNWIKKNSSDFSSAHEMAIYRAITTSNNELEAARKLNKMRYGRLDPSENQRGIKNLQDAIDIIEDMTRNYQMRLYDPKRKKQRKGSWLDFVKQHKHMRTAKGLLDLKAISKLWKGKGSKTVTHKNKKPAGSWRLFVKARMGPYMKKYGSHGAAIRQIAKEWKGQKEKALDPGWNAGRKNTLWNKVNKYRRLSRYGDHEVVRDHDRRTYDPPKSWFKAMYTGIKNRSDVRNPGAIVNNIWKKLTPQKRAMISAQAKKGKRFTYDLPLPDDRATKGTGTLRMVKPFKLAEVQVNLKVSDYLAALKSGLFSKMKRNDGTVALVARCKSEHKNCNIFVDKVT